MRSQPSFTAILFAVIALGLAACGGGSGGSTSTPSQPSGEGGHYKALRPYQINGRWYEPYYDPSYRQVGTASWYGDPFHGRKTANGERYDKRLLSAAHPTLPLPSVARVTNLENGRVVEVRVNDRGPFAGNRLIDMSEAAAEVLGFKHNGLARVEVEFIALAPSSGKPPTPTRGSTRTQTAAAILPVRPQAAPATVSAPQAPIAPSTTSAACGLYIQVGAFAEPLRAQAVALMLQSRFPRPVRGNAVREGQVTRVRVGPFDGVDSAHRALAAVSREGYDSAFIMELSGAAEHCPPRTA